MGCVLSVLGVRCVPCTTGSHAPKIHALALHFRELINYKITFFLQSIKCNIPFFQLGQRYFITAATATDPVATT